MPVSRRGRAARLAVLLSIGSEGTPPDLTLADHRGDAPLAKDLQPVKDAAKDKPTSKDLPLAKDKPVTKDTLPVDKKLADKTPPDKSTCVSGSFFCLADGTASYCSGGSLKLVGTCALGCNAATKSCYRPSNVSAELVAKGTAEVNTNGIVSAAINTDTGEITSLRAAGTGLVSGIYYEQVAQTGGVGLGVFSMKKLTVAAGTMVRAKGSRSLVLLVPGAVVIAGTINVTGDGGDAGPGGGAGGIGGQKGGGSCPGLTGTGDTYMDYCSSGGGGGGHGGIGADGGDSACFGAHAYSGGKGGGTCGNASLSPLVGGSGGAGGTKVSALSYPGPGGGGGGAIQISSGLSISVSGGINAGGGGGGESRSAGGAGGGAGGAILLEAASISLGILAANGGGGGGGDCT